MALPAVSYFDQYRKEDEENARLRAEGRRTSAQQAEDRKSALEWMRRRGGSGRDALPPPAANAPSTKGVDSMTWILQNRNQRRAESRGGDDTPTVWHIGGNYDPETGRVEGGRTFIEGGSSKEVPAQAASDAIGAGATDAMLAGSGRLAYAERIAGVNERKRAVRDALGSMGIATQDARGRPAKGYEWLHQPGDDEITSGQRNQVRRAFQDSFDRIVGAAGAENGPMATNAPKNWTDKKRLDEEAARKAAGGKVTVGRDSALQPGSANPGGPRQSKSVYGTTEAVPRVAATPERRELERRIIQEARDRANWLWTTEGKSATEREEALKVGSYTPWDSLDHKKYMQTAIENMFAQQDVVGLRRLQAWMRRLARTTRSLGFNPLSPDEV